MIQYLYIYFYIYIYIYIYIYVCVCVCVYNVHISRTGDFQLTKTDQTCHCFGANLKHPGTKMLQQRLVICNWFWGCLGLLPWLFKPAWSSIYSQNFSWLPEGPQSPSLQKRISSFHPFHPSHFTLQWFLTPQKPKEIATQNVRNCGRRGLKKNNGSSLNTFTPFLCRWKNGLPACARPTPTLFPTSRGFERRCSTNSKPVPHAERPKKTPVTLFVECKSPSHLPRCEKRKQLSRWCFQFLVFIFTLFFEEEVHPFWFLRHIFF